MSVSARRIFPQPPPMSALPKYTRALQQMDSVTPTPIEGMRLSTERHGILTMRPPNGAELNMAASDHLRSTAAGRTAIGSVVRGGLWLPWGGHAWRWRGGCERRR